MIYYVGTACNKQVVDVRLDAIGTYSLGKRSKAEKEDVFFHGRKIIRRRFLVGW